MAQVQTIDIFKGLPQKIIDDEKRRIENEKKQEEFEKISNKQIN